MSGASKFAFGGGNKTPENVPPEALTETLVQYILKNDAQKIQAMIAQGADVNASDGKGNSMIVIAATDPREHKALDAVLFAQPDLNQPGKNGKLPLHAVLRMKDDKIMEDTVDKLLNAGADPNKIETREGQPPTTAFLTALENNRSDAILQRLLKAGADPALGEDRESSTLAPLHVLARLGRYGILQAAHAAGVDIDKPDYNGITPLMWAAREGSVKTVEFLLQCGADPTLKDKAGQDAPSHASHAPPDTDMRPLIQQMARAAQDHLVRKEIAELRAEVDDLKRIVKSKGT